MLLLLIVRNAISCTLYVPYKTTLMVMNENIPWLARHSTCFVTHTQFDQLRGRIETLEPYRSQFTNIKSNTVSAALHDPSFQSPTQENIHYSDSRSFVANLASTA